MNGLRFLKNCFHVTATCGGVIGGVYGGLLGSYYLSDKGLEYGKEVEKKYSLIPYVMPIFFRLSGLAVGGFGGGAAGAIGGAAIGLIAPVVIPAQITFKTASVAYDNFTNRK